MTPTPRVFISATSGDLTTARKAAVQALTTLGCLPVEQSHFAPDARNLPDMLREKIQDCAAVLHIAGFRYGAEPSPPPPDKPRRSYTQMEFDTAVELGREVYIFLPDEDFPFDDADASPEDEERRALQLEHREALMNCGKHYTPIKTHALLREKLRELQVQVDELKRLIAQQDQKLKKSGRRALWLGISIVVLLAFFAWDKVEAREEREQASKNLAEWKRLVESGLGAKAALVEVASGGGKEPKKLARMLDTFGKHVAADPKASPADKEQAAFLNQFADLNALLFAAPDAGISAAAAKIALEKREKTRNSFIMGVFGPWHFAIAFVGNVLTPHKSLPASKSLADEYRELKGRQFPEPQAPPKTAGDKTAAPVSPIISRSTPETKTVTGDSPVRQPINYEDYVLKPGSPPETAPDDAPPSLISPAHWTSAVDRAWDQTWGVGPGNYRVGFVFGCILLPLVIREVKLRRGRKEIANSRAGAANMGPTSK